MNIQAIDFGIHFSRMLLKNDVSFVELTLLELPLHVLSSLKGNENLRDIFIKFLEENGCVKGGILYEEIFAKYRITELFVEPQVANNNYEVTNYQLRTMIYDFLENKAMNYKCNETLEYKLFAYARS